jgi:nicotinamide-nucleotide amidase
MYNISILSIGDELCIGQTVNTNASWMSNKLLPTGAFILTHSVIRDDKETIISEIHRLSRISNLIIITGGLGPTHDDITKKVICEYFDDELELNEEVLDKLKNWFEKRGRDFYKRHELQAMLPKKAKILPNEVGTAQGMLFEEKNFSLISLPGVPREMRFIVENSIVNYVKDQIAISNSKVQIYRTIKTVGIAESDLAELIGDLGFLGDISLAFLPSYKGIRLRIGLSGDNRESVEMKLLNAENELIAKIGKYLLSRGDEDLSKAIGNLLIKKNLTISVAESCTGGLLGANITDIPGSSNYFLGGVISYSNEAKTSELGIPDQVLNIYGAVSEETAILMAKSVREKFSSSFGISITGVAGPGGGSEIKPVGTVWIGLSDEYDSFAKKFVFSKDRQINRELSVGYALTLLFNRIRND